MDIKKYLNLSGYAFFIICSDFFLKAYVNQHIPLMNGFYPRYPYGGMGIFQNWHGIDFSINHVINKGAAWGILSSFQEYLIYFRVFAVIAMMGYVVFSKKTSAKITPFVLIIAGAIGNIIDFFVYGHVVDMFHFHFHLWNYTFPIFNLADCSIFFGVAWLFILSLTSKKVKGQVNSKASRELG